MSSNISLIEYESSNDGSLYEENLAVIESAFLSPDILEVLKSQDNLLLDELEIFEEENSSESSTVEYIPSINIQKIKELLENKFVCLIECEEAQSLRSLLTPESVFELMEKSRILTNVYYILWLKNEKFFKKNNVLVKIG